MKLFAHDDEVTSDELALPLLEGTQRVIALASLAWKLRQRDTPRSLRLGEECKSLLACHDVGIQQSASVLARLHLVEAEAVWLSGNLLQAQLLMAQALEEFAVIADTLGCADVHWALSWVAADLGDLKRCNEELHLAISDGQSASDPLRVDVFTVALATWAVLRDRQEAFLEWGDQYPADLPDQDPSLALWVSHFWGLHAFQTSDYGLAANCFIRASEAGLRTGQIHRAVLAVANVGYAFGKLNDLPAALEWNQRGLSLARPTGWPAILGVSLMLTAETLRKLGRSEASHELLDQAFAALQPLAMSRNYAVALDSLGELALDESDYPLALDTFCKLEERARALNFFDYQINAWCGQASALSRLNRPQEALEAATKALSFARKESIPLSAVRALRALAEIHAAHDLSSNALQVANPVLQYLNQATELASSIPSYTVPADLLIDLSRACAATGDMGRAYDLAMRAIAVRDEKNAQEAANRAVSVQVQYQAERAKAEAEHHRTMANAQAQRATLLQRTNDALQRLSEIGREITLHRDTQTVFSVLAQHVQALLDAFSFTAYFVSTDGLSLNLAFGVEEGKPLGADRIDLVDPSSNAARCVREQRTLVLDDMHSAPGTTWVEGSRPTRSALFVPLSLGGRVIGAMSVQSLSQNAYDERDRLIFETLCAYGAIALDNADAYRQLRDTQAQLATNEKMAALGALVAGIAHELNTPLGNCLVLASTMEFKTRELTEQVEANALRRSELVAYCSEANHASDLIMRALTRAAELVKNFKLVAVDSRTAERFAFDLQQVLVGALGGVLGKIQGAGHQLVIQIPAGIGMDGYPGPLGDVVLRLIDNALGHAFANPGGTIHLTVALKQQGWVHIEVSDDGIGIEERHLGRVFDPFFTTRLGQGGNGLGLNVCYNIVTALLGGHIAVRSEVGKGATFALDLPLVAPST